MACVTLRFFFLTKKEESNCSIRSFIQENLFEIRERKDQLSIDVNEIHWSKFLVELDAYSRSEFVHYERLRRKVDDHDELDYHSTKISSKL